MLWAAKQLPAALPLVFSLELDGGRPALVSFTDQLCPLVSLELDNALNQLVHFKAASVAWSVQHLGNQTEQFPCSGLAQQVSH